MIDVNYSFYLDGMNHGIVPNEKTFNKFKEQNALFLQSLIDDGLVTERKAGDFKRCLCLMIETDFEHEEKLRRLSLSSESVGGYSVSYDNTEKNRLLELNAKSVEKEKYQWLKLYCVVHSGRR